MKDYLVKATAYNGLVRAYATSTTNMVNEACKRQDTWPTASAALGRTLTITGMMGCMLKGDDTITAKVEGDGPIGAIIADANASGDVRGYVLHPHVDFPSNPDKKLDVQRAVGKNGTLTVVKDQGLKDNFSGQVPIVSGEISEDFTYYFATSEQVPTAVASGVIVDTDYSIIAAGGFIIQLIPDASEEVITALENKINNFPSISSLIRDGKSPEVVIELLFEDAKLRILETIPVNFECQCSHDRMLRAINGLGEDEIRAMIEEDHGADAKCHFCNEVYKVSEEELRSLLK